MDDLPDGPNRLNGNIFYQLGDITTAATLDPFTHVHMFDKGMPPYVLSSISKSFNSSVHTRYLVSFHPPKDVVDMYKFDVVFLCKRSMTMSGKLEFVISVRGFLTYLPFFLIIIRVWRRKNCIFLQKNKQSRKRSYE